MAYHRLQVRKRASSLTGAQVRQLRRAGRIPAVVSRKGEPSLELTAELKQLQAAAHHTGIGGILLLVDEESGDEHLGMLKVLQWEPVSRKLLHAGFQEVNASQVVQTSVTLIFHGEPEPVVRHEAQLLKSSESIDVTAQVRNLPTAIALDISELAIGDVVTAGDVPLPEGCEPTNPDSVICSVVAMRVATPEEEEAAAAAAGEEPSMPELVGQRGKEEDSSE
jgi:large subunit ribosomal protein L25